MSSADRARKELIEAALGYYQAGVETLPDVNGVSARLWCGVKLRLAAIEYGKALRVERFEREGTA